MEDRDALDTRRKKLHALPRWHPAADSCRGRGISPAGAGLALTRRSDPHRAHLPVQEFRRGLRLCRACRGVGRGRGSSPRYLFRLGLRDGVAAHEEDQRAARERFHHGGKTRPHRRRLARTGSRHALRRVSRRSRISVSSTSSRGGGGGGAASFGASQRRRLTCRTSRKIANATMTKRSSALMNRP